MTDTPRKDAALVALNVAYDQIGAEKIRVLAAAEADLPPTPLEQAQEQARRAASDAVTRVWEILRAQPGLSEDEQRATRLKAAELVSDVVRELGATITRQEAQRVLSSPMRP